MRTRQQRLPAPDSQGQSVGVPPARTPSWKRVSEGEPYYMEPMAGIEPNCDESEAKVARNCWLVKRIRSVLDGARRYPVNIRFDIRSDG